MTAPNDGGAAFPNIVHGAIADYQVCEGGMSLRDYFAAQVLPALLATNIESMRIGCQRPQSALVAMSYEFADAMLAERAKARA